MLFFDCEVFRFDWIVVAIDPTMNKPYVVVNDRDLLQQLYDTYQEDIWIGYNNRHYDQYIIKAILLHMDPWDVNNFIITKNEPGWAYHHEFNKLFMINYDVMQMDKSLKQLEGFQGHNIHESSIDFNIRRPLTAAELDETVKYCTNDVLETINIFKYSIDDYKALLWLVKEFKFPLSYMGKTKAQISAEILGCEKNERFDTWGLFVLNCIKLGHYGILADNFLNPRYQNYNTEFNHVIASVDHTLGWGGIHGGRKKYHYKCDRDHLMIHVDVESYYPRIMIFHGLLTRNAKYPERFRQIFERRMELKHAGKKKEQAPYKIVINGTFGISKDPTNKAYDPRNANLICVNGQLMLVDLIDKLEAIKSFELIQSNTDGLIIKILRSDFEQLDDICYEWESRCSMVLGFDYIKEIWQKDVNNYVFIDFEDKAERKGAYVKELSPIDNDLPILNKAVVDYMLKGTPVETTINNCNSLILFQKICKLTGSYDCIHHNNITYRNKCYRVFASKDMSDGSIYKVKLSGRADKVANTSRHVFIDNSDITNKPVPDKLDRTWYISEAKKRLSQYGIDDQLNLWSVVK